MVDESPGARLPKHTVVGALSCTRCAGPACFGNFFKSNRVIVFLKVGICKLALRVTDGAHIVELSLEQLIPGPELSGREAEELATVAKDSAEELHAASGKAPVEGA